MTWAFGHRSRNKLTGVNPDLVKVCFRALELSPVDFGIICGLRTPDEQMKMVKKGASQTLHSKHITGRAIDFGVYVNGVYVNGDTPKEYKLYEQVADAFMQASRELKIPIVWGGSWKTLKDGGHIELK